MANVGYNVGTALSFIGLVLSVDKLQAICSLIATCLGIVLIIIDGVIKVSKRIREAKKDGKITHEELEDIAGDVKDTIEDVVDKVNENSK